MIADESFRIGLAMNPADRSTLKNYVIVGVVVATILYGVVIVLVLRHDVRQVKENRYAVDHNHVDQ